MTKYRVLLSVVAFITSGCISLFFGQGISGSLVTGLITIPAVLASVFVTDYQRKYQAKSALAALRTQTRALQRQKANLHKSLIEISAEKQQVSAGLNTLQMQLRQLQIQALEKWEQNEEFSWQLSALDNQKQQLEEHLYNSKTRIQALEQQEATLHDSLLNLGVEKIKLEASLQALQTDFNQLQAEVVGQETTKAKLSQEIEILLEQKHQIQQELPALHLQQANQPPERLNPFLRSQVKSPDLADRSAPLQLAAQQLQTQVSSLRSELDQLEAQILEKRLQKETLNQELMTLQQQKYLQTGNRLLLPAPVNGNYNIDERVQRTITPLIHNADREVFDTTAVTIAGKSTIENDCTQPAQPAASPQEFPNEWAEFLVQLAAQEFQALKAVVEEENPTVALRKIAEAHLTMPELLIDAINEQAVATLGDIVIEPGSGATSATIAQEHLVMVKQVIAVYEYLTN